MYVGYVIDDFGDWCPLAAGPEYNDVFTRTFARIAPAITPMCHPQMAVQQKDITEDQAAELERIVSEKLAARDNG